MILRIAQRLPTCDEYNMLRQRCGWRIYDPEIATKALASSLFCVVAEGSNGEAVGMGRLIGDGHIYVHVQDVLVIPEFQRMGVGRRIMDEIFGWLDKNVADNTNIGLFASKGRENFYRAFGFQDRPNEKFGSGMMITKRDIIKRSFSQA